jgi:hypothetical protein
VWGISGCLDETGRKIFDEFFQRLILFKDIANQGDLTFDYGPHDFVKLL